MPVLVQLAVHRRWMCNAYAEVCTSSISLVHSDRSSCKQGWTGKELITDILSPRKTNLETSPPNREDQRIVAFEDFLGASLSL